MNNQLKCLIDLQHIDSKILDFNHVLDAFPSRIAEAETPLKKSQAILDAIMQKLHSLEKKKRDKEGELDDINEKINKNKSRISEIKTNKEYQAYLKEIESVEKDRYDIEDDILIVMEEIDFLSQQLKSEEIRIHADREKVEALKKEMIRQKSKVEKDILQLKEIRLKIVNSVDHELYDQYISLIESRSGIAVIEAKEEICLGCNMNIPPQLYVEVKRNEEIIHCPQCQRILYYKNSA